MNKKIAIHTCFIVKQEDVEIQLLKADNLYTDLSDQLNETNVIINVLNKLCRVCQLILK
jgi:hypothetical protein